MQIVCRRSPDFIKKLGIGNKTTFIKNVRERHPDIKVKDIQIYGSKPN
jgi:hypothetical protein